MHCPMGFFPFQTKKKNNAKTVKKDGACLCSHTLRMNIKLYANEEKFSVVRNVKPCKWYKLYDPEKHRA